jgi:hypothetical protein
MFTWNLIDGTGGPQSTGCGETVPYPTGGSRRSPACPECRGTRFVSVDWVERVSEDSGCGSLGAVDDERRPRHMPEAAFGHYLWCEACGSSFDLPLELEHH